MMTASPAAVHLRALDPFDFLERAAFVYPEKLAVVDGAARRTYPEFLERVRRLAAALQGMGIRAGERVAVLAPNTSMVLEATYAVPLAGGVLCALNTRLAPDEIDYILGHCGASLLLHDYELDGLVGKLATQVPRARVAAPGETNPNGAFEYERFLAAADPAALLARAGGEDDTLSINYTSGTTGKPKGVMYTFRGAYVNALAEVFHANLRPESVYLWTLPMFHCNGWCFPWAVTAAGATHVCLRKVDAAGINHGVHAEGVTHFCAAPTVLIGLVNHPETVQFPHRVIVTTAGAPPAPATIAQIEALGAELHHVYGLTETYGPITECAWHSPQWDALPAAERARLRSRQGVPMVTLGAADVRVVDSELNDVPADGTTQGEIVMRGNNVMKGYYADPEATARAFAGGWFHSGDVAVRHPDGYVEIVDRAKDVIISGGENISTQQVEKVLLEHDAVLECAIVAVPDPKWGEVPKAFVTLKPNRTAEPDELREFMRARIAAFKVPKSFEFCDLPKTSTGKIGEARGAGSHPPYGPGYPIAPGHYRLLGQVEHDPATAEDGPGAIDVGDLDQTTLRRLIDAGRARTRGESIEIASLPGRAGGLAQYGRTGIVIHGGAGAANLAAADDDPLAPYQRLTRSDGGIRLHNADMARLLIILKPAFAEPTTIVLTVLGDPPRSFPS